MSVTAGGKPLWAPLDTEDWERLREIGGKFEMSVIPHTTHHKHPALSDVLAYHSHNGGDTPHTHNVELRISSVPLKIEVDDDAEV